MQAKLNECREEEHGRGSQQMLYILLPLLLVYEIAAWRESRTAPLRNTGAREQELWHQLAASLLGSALRPACASLQLQARCSWSS